jgi:hypothetical protein
LISDLAQWQHYKGPVYCMAANNAGDAKYMTVSHRPCGVILLMHSLVGILQLQCQHSFDLCLIFSCISVQYHLSLRGLTCSVIKTLPVPFLPARCETRIDQTALQCSPLNVTHTSGADRYLKHCNLDQCQEGFNHLLGIYLGRLDVQS